MLESSEIFFESYGLIGLFLICFLAATILPFSSELILLYFLSLEQFDPLTLLLIASLGNCLGGTTNYFLGYYGNKIFLKKVNFQNKFLIQFQKYGFYGAFFSWIPFIGDPLLIALGFLKTALWLTFFFMCFGKILRYAVLIYFY
ncbi:MAG: YqaA family protein [Bacteroidota bacterium]